jgi:hypothetical protein
MITHRKYLMPAAATVSFPIICSDCKGAIGKILRDGGLIAEPTLWHGHVSIPKTSIGAFSVVQSSRSLSDRAAMACPVDDWAERSAISMLGHARIEIFAAGSA